MKTKKPKIITLCGSTKFKNQFHIEEKRLTLEGYIVLSVHVFSHSGDKELINPETKKMLIELHKHKIDLSDEIYIINVDSYIGDGLNDEIQYAIKTNKKIKYMTPNNSSKILFNNKINDFKLKCKDFQFLDKEIEMLFNDFIIENENDIIEITNILQQYRKKIWNKLVKRFDNLI